jgi:hydroxypyruvate isomerase
VIDRRAVLVGTAIAASLAACANEGDGEPEGRRDLLSGYAVNLESWYRDQPFLARFDQAVRDGFTSVEFWSPVGDDRTPDAAAKAARDARLNVVQIVGGAPNLALSDRQTRQIFLDMCKVTVEHAATLQTRIATIVGHAVQEGVTKADSLAAYADHLAAAASIFEAAGVTAVIEPFNPYDHPGHFLYGSSDAIQIVQAVNSPAVKINWDLFHMQRYEGELIGNLRRAGDTIGYVQLADAPDRAQPGTGDVNYANVIKAVREAGYDRPIGLEFWAKDDDYNQAVLDMLRLSEKVNRQG